jgi:hypothetical protein
MTDNIHYLKQDAPVNENVGSMIGICSIHYDLRSALDKLACISKQSTAEKRAVVNVIEDIARRCDKFLEDI